VSNLRDYETLKTLRTNILAKNGSFVSDKALLFWQRKFSQSFMIFGRKGKEKTTLDHKYQIFSNLCEAKKQGRLQHRLQLGILLPCEARRTADQVPKNWVYGVIVKRIDKKVGKSFCLITQKFFEL
jgi:hypothetical protein